MPKGFALIALSSLFLFIFGCGGAQQGAAAGEGASDDTASKTDAETGAGPRFSRVELTTAVDEKRMVAAAPASTEFLPDTKRIFLVGVLDRSPGDAQIEVQWLKADGNEPIYVSRGEAASDNTVLSMFRPESDAFLAGDYRVLVYAGGKEIQVINFRITDRRSGGTLRVKELAVSESVEAKSKSAINPATSFRPGISKIFASFFVSGLEPGGTMRVLWYRDEEPVKEEDIECEGEKRYTAFFENPKGLAKGEWAVEVEVDGEMFARRTFFVGQGNLGPVVEKAALGLAPGKNGMPSKELGVFNQGTRKIHCGVRILDLPDNSSVELEWIFLKDGSEEVVHSSETKIEKGKNSTVGSAWEPGGKLSSGSYVVVVSVNGRKMAELPFEVK